MARFNIALMTCEPADLIYRLLLDGHGRVLLDGEPVDQVWYADSERGEVRTFDVFGDGKAHATHSINEPVKGIPDGCEDSGGVLSRTMYGEVKIQRRIPRVEPPLFETVT